MEESELDEVLRSAVADRECVTYKRVINAIFSQPFPLAKTDFAYDSSLYKVSIRLLSGC
jgi:hypothetical protein